MKKICHIILSGLMFVMYVIGNVQAQQCSVKYVVTGYPDTIMPTTCNSKISGTPNYLQPADKSNRFRPHPDSCGFAEIPGTAESFANSSELFWYIKDSIPQKYIRFDLANDTVKVEMLALTALFKPSISPISGYDVPSGKEIPVPKPGDIPIQYGVPTDAAMISSCGVRITPGYMCYLIPTNEYPTTLDGYKNIAGTESGTYYPYRLTPMSLENRTCLLSYDDRVRIIVEPRNLTIKARHAILRVDDDKNIYVPSTDASNVEGYIKTRYEAVGMASIDNLETIFSQNGKPTVKLKQEAASGDKYLTYKNLPPGRYNDEVIINGHPDVNENYNLNRTYQSAAVYITKINWRGFRETLIYGDTLKLDATYNTGGRNYTNLLQYASSNTGVIAVTRQGTNWTAQIKGIGSAYISVMFQGAGAAPADTAVYQIQVKPYGGLRISVNHDTLPKYDAAVLTRYRTSGLKYNDEVPLSDVRIQTPANERSGQGTYPLTVCCFSSRNYSPVEYVNGSITIFKLGDSLQNLHWLQIPPDSAAVGTTLTGWAEALGTVGRDRGETRPLRYSSSNPQAISVARDTMTTSNGQRHYGAILKINNIGSANIRAYQRGDSLYRDTDIVKTIMAVKGRHSLCWGRERCEDIYPDTLTVNSYILLNTFVRSTSGLPAIFEVDNRSVARISGDTLFGLKRGKAIIKARLPSHPNYWAADSIVNECSIISDNVSLKVDNASMIPAFDAVKYTDYTLILPCWSDKSNANNLATLSFFYDVDRDSLYCNGIPQGLLPVCRISEKNISDCISGSLDTIDELKFVLRRDGATRMTYNIKLQKQLHDVMAQLWESSQVLVIDINKVNQLGYDVKSYQWYYSRSAKYPLQGAIHPYLEVSKLSYTSGYYSAQLTTNEDEIVEICPFEIPPTISSAAPQKIKVYPNPVRDWVTIENPQWQYAGSIYLYDSNGSVARQYPSTAEQQTLDISGIRNGLYFIRAGDAVMQITIL